MTNFAAMSPREIAEFLVAHQGELGIADLTAQQVTDSLASGTSALETREFGFALIQHPQAQDGATPHLWALFIDSDRRGAGLGSRLVREILKKHGGKHMSLWCEGPRRRRFFGRLGFFVEGRLGELRRMTTNRDAAMRRRFIPEGQ